MSNNVHCRLYIEGHQIPFNYISINASANGGSTASINIAPDEHVKDIYPRSHVLILFLDHNNVWRVLWDGEFRGWSVSKSAGGVSMQITASDYSNVLSFITRYILDGSGMSQDANIQAIFQTGAQINFEPSGGGNFVNLVRSYFEESESDDFASVMTNLIGATWNDIPYFREAMQSNRLLQRIVSLPDEQINRILTNSISARYMEGIIQNQFVGNVPFEQVLNYFLQVAGYMRVPMIAPPSVDGTPPVMLLKPEVHFTTPPCCNCLFPGMYTSCSGLSVDYFSEPTRIMLQTEMAARGGFTRMYFFNESDQVDAASAEPGNMALVKGIVSKPELDRGILPIVRPVSFERALLARGEDPNDEAVQDSMMAYAWYDFINEKYGRRQFTATCGFHPYAVVGFPGVVFDRFQTLFGTVQSVSHNISSDGNASTVMSFSHGHPASLSDSNNLSFPPIPNWVSKKYRPEEANDTYKALFGENEVEGPHAALGGEEALDAEGAEVIGRRYAFATDKQYHISQIAARVFPIPSTGIDSLAGILRASEASSASTLWESHQGNQSQFEEQYTRRNIISARAYLGFMGIDSEDIGSVLSEKADLFSHPSEVSFVDDTYDVTERDSRKYDAASRLQHSLTRSAGKLGG